MNLTELRAIADYHLARARDLRTASLGMEPCPAAAALRLQARQHGAWFQGLSELADALATLGQFSATPGSVNKIP